MNNNHYRFARIREPLANALMPADIQTRFHTGNVSQNYRRRMAG